MDRKSLFTLAEDILNGYTPDNHEFKALAAIKEHDVFSLFSGADMIREFHFGREIHFCCICNGKSGKCSEDCSFCSQSAFAQTDAPVYPLMKKNQLQKGGLWAQNKPVNRYSIVTSGKRLPQKEVLAIADSLSELAMDKISTCASLGILDTGDFDILKKAGVSRFHHNLETSQSFFDQMCTTHNFQERIDTILSAKQAGLSVCSGGVFGIGESDEQVLELALTLRDLDIDAVPINFLVPIKGTLTENRDELSPLRCLKIISIFRYVLPKKDIFVCGGREHNLKELHPFMFQAGASGIMTGDYLTTSGQTLEKDLEMIVQLGFSTRTKI